ncbi:MAG: tetratricopeptide repeat protein [Kiritimatiellaeota bacterium]|nr:tetratricopeptide repeat protein [Kiritimatiellota bacterium]
MYLLHLAAACLLSFLSPFFPQEVEDAPFFAQVADEASGGDAEDAGLTPEARLETLEKRIAAEPENPRHYLDIVRQCFHMNRMEDAEKWMREAGRRNLDVDFAFEQATLLFSDGKTDEARLILQEIIEGNPKNHEALSMLAFIMLEEQDFAGVQRHVLDRIERMEGTRKGYYYQLVAGKLAMAMSTNAVANRNEAEAMQFQREARDHFYNAFRARPDVAALATLVLELDFALADRASARRHATEILRRDRGHPFASWILGSLLFQDGDYAAAAEYFRHSVESKPEARNLNDYAEVLRRLDKPAESERYAREAIEAAAKEDVPLYECVAHDTLARALHAQGKLTEARAASLNAIKIAQENLFSSQTAQLKLTLLHTAVTLSDMDEAKPLAAEILAELKRDPASLDPGETQEFNALLEKIGGEQP